MLAEAGLAPNLAGWEGGGQWDFTLLHRLLGRVIQGWAFPHPLELSHLAMCGTIPAGFSAGFPL